MNAAARRPRLALGAGLLMPGLGHLYAGDLPRGLCFLLGIALAVPGAVHLALWGPTRFLSFVVFAGVAVAIASYVWSVWDAVHLARRASAKTLHSWQRPLVYALYVVASYVFVLAPATAGVRRDLLEAFMVPTASQSPGILPGDRIFVDKTIGQPGGAKLWRGAIVVFIYPNDRTTIFIKRVIGLPGDRIEIAGNDLRVNGHRVSEGPAIEPLPRAFAGLRALRERGDRGQYTVLWPAGEANPSVGPLPDSFVIPDG